MSKVTQIRPTIIHVTSYYPPHLGGLGGQEKGTALRAERFVDKGYEVFVYTSDIGYSPRHTPDTKVHVHYLKSIEFAHTPIIFTLFFRLLTLPHHSIIHLHVAQAFSPEIVYAVSKLKRIPYIAHIHLDVDTSGPFGFLLKPYKKVFLKQVLKSAAKIICVSEANRNLIASKYTIPLESIVTIPNGVAEEYFVEKRKRQNSVPRLLFVGRLSIQKNLSLLIEAVSQMQTSVFLDIVGEGELRKDLEALIKNYKLHNVQLHGQKIGKELIELYKAADVFVLPSFKEAGLPNSVLEALAAGLPVVASDLPEMRDSLNDCGVIIQEPTPINYAKALDGLLSDKQTMQNLSVLSLQKARSRSWENVLDATEVIYNEVYKM